MQHEMGGEYGDAANGMGMEYPMDGTLAYDGDEWKDNKRNGVGKRYLPNGTLLYDGEWKDNEPNGEGKVYGADGTLLRSGLFAKGVYRPSRKRKRNIERDTLMVRTRVVKMHSSTPLLSDIPTCTMCLEYMHHGDPSFVYVPCGHRVVCGPCEATIPAKWRTQCPMCKVNPAQMMRVH